MAYRFEKEENGKYAIIIDGWSDGIAPDPYKGINRLSTVNLEVPNEVSVGYPLTPSVTSGGGSVLGNPIAKSVRYFPTYITQGTSTGAVQSYAILDANGRVWESTTITGTFTFLSSSNSTSGSTANDGVAYWLGYLFKFRGSNLDYWNGSTWSTGWKTSGDNISSGVKHFCYVATNNQLYFTNGNFIGRIFAPDATIFDPTNTSTYNFNAQILELNINDSALSMCEIGGGSTPQSTLLIGGSQNAIYPWDKISTSFQLPIYVADNYIKNLVSANQNAFIFPGNTAGRGRIYITNGSQADLYFKIPDYLFGEQDPYYVWGDAMFHRNNLIFGFSPMHNSGSGDIFVQFNSEQLWALSLESKNITGGYTQGGMRSITTLFSNGVNATNATVLIGATNPSTSGFSYIAATADSASNWGIGYSGTTSGFSINSFSSISPSNIVTDLMPVGTFLQKTTFAQIEYKLRTPLKSGESITIATVVDGVQGNNLTFSPTVTTGAFSGTSPIDFTGAQWLQLYIRMIGNNASSGVRLKEIRIR